MPAENTFELPGLGVAPVEDPPDWSDAELTSLEQEEQVQLMLQWFYWNFEDPAESTPYESREGGYQYIWGGPYEASDELQARFYDLVSYETIEVAVKEADTISWQWVPHSNRIRPEDQIFQESETTVPNMSAQDYFDSVVRPRLHEVEDSLSRFNDSPPQIGHNGPPESIYDSPVSETILSQMRQTVHETSVEGLSGSPDPSRLRETARLFTSVSNQVLRWLAAKADVVAHEMAKSFGRYIGRLLAVGIPATLAEYYFELITRLSTAADVVFDWIVLLGQ